MTYKKNIWFSDEASENLKGTKLDFLGGSGDSQKFTIGGTKINYTALEQEIIDTRQRISDRDATLKNIALSFGDPLEKMAKHSTSEFLKGKMRMGKVAKDDTPKPELEESEEGLDEDSARFLRRRGSEMLVWYPRKASGGGYDDSVVTSDPIPHFNIRDLLARFFIQTHASYGVVPNWRLQVIGVTSLYLESGFGNWGKPVHLPMFDYDGRNIKTLIRKDVKLLQKNYGLGDAWVYETRRGFHVYFFCDLVGSQAFFSMLDAVHCCPGFKRAAAHKGSAVLRVSGKYTDFDIKLLYVLPTSDRAKIRRLGRKAHTIQALLALGEECGTHFASMFPQWAHYQEDQKEWKPAPKPKAGKRIRKVSMEDYEQMKQQKETYQPSTEKLATGPATTVTFSTNTSWVNVGNSGGTSTSGF